VLFGHLTRLAVWYLRHSWQPTLDVLEKLNQVARFIQGLGIDRCLPKNVTARPKRWELIREEDPDYGDEQNEEINPRHAR